jgi:release factor glutamine methyltransferase
MSSAELWTVGRLLQWTTDYLKSHGADSPRLDAEVLLAHAMGCRRIELYTSFDEVPQDDARAVFRESVRRRAEGMPVAYLVGSREFYSLAFHVTPDVLIPRPETEQLVVAALDWAKENSPRPLGDGVRATDISADGLTLADIGTGSGILAVCLAKHLPTCRVTAVDISPAALTIAAENAKRHSVAERIEFIESDLFAQVPPERQFDCIVSNPPYIAEHEMRDLAADVRKFEPRMALTAGPKGTEVIERLIPQAAERLRPGGCLLIEISPMIHDAVCTLFASDTRFELGPTIKDFARLPRVVQGKKRG